MLSTFYCVKTLQLHKDNKITQTIAWGYLPLPVSDVFAPACHVVNSLLKPRAKLEQALKYYTRFRLSLLSKFMEKLLYSGRPASATIGILGGFCYN
jgi:hypothetical protein